LSELDLKITLSDCSAPESCVVIGEASENIYTNVPPGQARDFYETLYFDGQVPEAQGQLIWGYEVKQTKATITDH
jgi:hypothetical protein